MTGKLSFVLLFVTFIAAVIHGLPVGAPETACFDMSPIHSGNPRQNSTPPYTVEYTWDGGDVLTGETLECTHGIS